MKTWIFIFCSVLMAGESSFASGCFSDKIYDLKALAQSVGADGCKAEKLEKISDPQSMADRQYNYYAEKMNEYVKVFGGNAFNLADVEFMFYPQVRKNSLSAEDARKVDFSYTQVFTCHKNGESKQVSSEVFTYGIVGLTGVCFFKNNQNWQL